MSIRNIRIAFEKKHKSVSPSVPIAYENVQFDSGKHKGVAYERVQLFPQAPLNPTFGDGYYREVGSFVILLSYPVRQGSSSATERAEFLRDTFHRGLTLVEGSTEVTVENTPRISAGSVADDRYILTVTVDYFSSNFNF